MASFVVPAKIRINVRIFEDLKKPRGGRKHQYTTLCYEYNFSNHIHTQEVSRLASCHVTVLWDCDWRARSVCCRSRVVFFVPSSPCRKEGDWNAFSSVLIIHFYLVISLFTRGGNDLEGKCRSVLRSLIGKVQILHMLCWAFGPNLRLWDHKKKSKWGENGEKGKSMRKKKRKREIERKEKKDVWRKVNKEKDKGVEKINRRKETRKKQKKTQDR